MTLATKFSFYPIHLPATRVPTVKLLSAIALFGLLLAISDSKRMIRQTGRSVALLAGGGVATMLVTQNRKGVTNTRPLEKALRATRVQTSELETALKTAQADQQCLLQELQETTAAESQLLSALALAQGNAQLTATEAKSRIAELEDSLAKKTEMATQMLTDLEAEATNTFQQFNAKITAQDNVINNLQQQIAAMRAENAALSAQQTEMLFANVSSNRLTNNPVASS